MKRRATCFVCLVPVILVITAFMLGKTAQAGVPIHQAPSESGIGSHGSTNSYTATAVVDIWGPEVGPSDHARATGLAPLAISGDELAANSTIVSDDFSACALDTSLWTFEDPKDDCSYSMIGSLTDDAWLSISVPVSSSHDIWKYGNFAPRVMQMVSDADFDIEVKFESGVSQQYQMQGVLVEEDFYNWLRFEFYAVGSDTRLYVASFEPDDSPPTLTYTVYYHQRITDTNIAPLYMRVQRQGNQWTPYYSYDGEGWLSPVTFPYTLTVTRVGVYAANHATPPEASPAHTGNIDYFFNTASPIDPEDADRNTLTTGTVGSGWVDVNPVKSNYDCGDVVTLETMADPGWSFDHWSGDLTGSDDPDTISMDGAKVVTATFTMEEYTLSVDIVGEGSVTKDPDQATYYYGDVVTLTASADPAWSFDSWSGDLAGSDNPDTLTIEGDTTVTATFVTHRYYQPCAFKNY